MKYKNALTTLVKKDHVITIRTYLNIYLIYDSERGFACLDTPECLCLMELYERDGFSSKTRAVK